MTGSQLCNPLDLYNLLEKADNHYPFAGVYEQMMAMLCTKQENNQSNTKWSETFNTCYEVAKPVGAEFDKFEYFWEYSAGLLGSSQ